MGLTETKNIKIARFDFITENLAFIPNGPAVSETKFQQPRIECDVARQQNQKKLPEGCLFMKCNFVCLDIYEQDGFDSRFIIFTYMQADITPALRFVLSIMPKFTAEK